MVTALPFPDPLPSDLAKAEAPLFLEEVVSTEVIKTDKNQETAAKAPGESATDFVDLERTEKSSITPCNSENTADRVVKSYGELGDEFNALEIKEFVSNDKKDVLEISKTETNVNGHNDPAEHPGKNPDEKEVMESNSESGAEFKSMGELEKTHLDITVDTEVTQGQKLGDFDDAQMNRSATELLETEQKDKEVVTNMTRDESAGFDIQHITETEELKEGLVCTEQTTEKTVKQDKCKIGSQDVHKLEAEQDETKERERFYLPEAYTHSGCSRKPTTKFSFNSEKVGLLQTFKHSIGYKTQANPYTYSAGQKSLRAFLQENCASKITGEKSGSALKVPEVTVINEETKKLKTIVDDLQDLFDESLRVEVDGISQAKPTQENEPGTKEDGKGGPEDLFVSQYEIIKKTKTFPPSQEETADNIENLRPMLNSEKLDSEDNFARESNGYNADPNGQGKSNQKPMKDKLSDQTITEKVTAGKNKVLGYRGKFSIGHFLDVERQKAADEQDRFESIVFSQEHETKAISSAGKTVKTEEESPAKDADHFMFDQVTVESKHQAEGRNERINLQQANLKLLENGQPSTKRESQSDQVNSEHSESDFTEDSDLDSTSSSDSEELKKAETDHKIQKSDRVNHSWLNSEASITQNGSSQNWHETQYNPYGIYHGNDSNPYNQSYGHFSSHQSQQLPWQQFAHYSDYRLPWFQYYGYHGYPQSQYTQGIPPHPYFGALQSQYTPCIPCNPYFSAQSLHSGTTFNQTLEATHRMQKEYIKAMCKMKD